MNYGRNQKRYDRYQDTHVINGFERYVFEFGEVSNERRKK